MGSAGGIDVGGSKIEAKLFSDAWADIESRRIDTPRDTYARLLDAIEEQLDWLVTKASDGSLPIGLGIPGYVEENSGCAVVANLPANGMQLQDDLIKRFGRTIWFENDVKAFTLSEARLGAGREYKNVLGLVLGTGAAVGFTSDGELTEGLNGSLMELGHRPVPDELIERHDLKKQRCGSGHLGCYETFVAGPGLMKLGLAKTGKNVPPVEIAKRASGGETVFVQIMDIWTDIAGSLVKEAILLSGTDCIVLGGGLSNIPGIEKRLMAHLDASGNGQTNRCPIFLAQGGDSSGARGAALVAFDAEGVKIA